eukprot:TRINITY_DN6449_c0_g1_i1.p1 TRINITY_DN6449_c0_g1~~TRINITY_DN6449_c0_g1_i1.p1  ORF type:complete len:116 (-),score=13.31 TRINITY_DN6449_c0_g1_i1:66-413(-)
MLCVKLLLSFLCLMSFTQAAPARSLQEDQSEPKIIRLRRAAQLVGASPSLAFLRSLSSGVSGSKNFNSAISSNVLGSYATPAKQCRWKLNRRYRVSFLVDQTGACCDSPCKTKRG